MSFTPDIEMVKVAVVPPHRCLDLVMEVMEIAVGKLDSSPDLGLDAEQGQLELVDGGGLLGHRVSAELRETG